MLSGVNGNVSNSQPSAYPHPALSSAESVQTKSTLKELPPEIMLEIFSYCTIEELATTPQVNKTWKNLTFYRNDLWWSNLLQKHGNQEWPALSAPCKILFSKFLDLDRTEMAFALFTKHLNTQKKWGFINICQEKKHAIINRCIQSIEERYLEEEPDRFYITMQPSIQALNNCNSYEDIETAYYEMIAPDSPSYEPLLDVYKMLILIRKLISLKSYDRVIEFTHTCDNLKGLTAHLDRSFVHYDHCGKSTFMQVGSMLFNVEKYDLAKECASIALLPENFFFVKHFRSELKAGTINEFYLSKFESDFSKYEHRCAHQELFFYCIKKGDIDRAKNLATKLIEHFHDYGDPEKEEFKQQLEKTGHPEFIALFENMH